MPDTIEELAKTPRKESSKHTPMDTPKSIEDNNPGKRKTTNESNIDPVENFFLLTKIASGKIRSAKRNNSALHKSVISNEEYLKTLGGGIISDELAKINATPSSIVDMSLVKRNYSDSSLIDNTFPIIQASRKENRSTSSVRICEHLTELIHKGRESVLPKKKWWEISGWDSKDTCSSMNSVKVTESIRKRAEA